MASSEILTSGVRREADGLRAGVLLAVVAVLVTVAWVLGGHVGLSLIAGAGAVLVLALIYLSKIAARQISRYYMRRFVEGDHAPCMLSDEVGRIAWGNVAAQTRFFEQGPLSLVRALSSLTPEPQGIIYRLQTRAAQDGSAMDECRLGPRTAVMRVQSIGRGQFLWRIEERVEADTTETPTESAAVGLPMLTVGRKGAVLFMNTAARNLFGQRVSHLRDVGLGEVARAGARVTVDSPTQGRVSAQVHVVSGAAGRQDLYLIPAQMPEQSAGAESVLEGLPVGIITLDADGEIQSINKLARDMLGPVDAAGDLSDLFEGLGRSLQDWFMDVAMDVVPSAAEVLHVRRPDKEVFLRVALSRVATPDGLQVVAILTDATELKTLEAQIVQSQKMQAIGQLAGGVAHDFNNLLTAISGHCDLLLMRHDKGDPDFGDIDQIAQNANRAASLVGQLLAFSRKQTLRPEVLDLRDALGELSHLLNRLVGEKTTLSVRHDPGLPLIRADKRQLEQVIMNLVVNARDAMPNGGEIKVDTRFCSLSEPLRRDRTQVPAGDYAIVKVADQGTGIPKELQQKIFEPFFTTKKTGEGTGLGLSTAYGIVKQTGGFIFCDSAPDQGTCFTLYLPSYRGGRRALAPDTTAATPTPIAMPPVVPHRPKIDPAPPKLPDSDGAAEGVVLLVEDEAPVRAFASRALRMRGFTVIEAENAEQALSMLEDPELSVDVFVTDVVMPGKDGPTWVREALLTRPDTKVVFVSGYAEDSFSDHQAKIPNSVFLPKPFSLSELTSTVRDQIH